MKVTHHPVGGTQPGLENSKANRADGSKGVERNSKSAHGAHSGDVKDGSKVDVSQRAQMMQKAKELASGNSVDEAKVARLQKLIDEGKYNVDAEKIADRLVDEHLVMPD